MGNGMSVGDPPNSDHSQPQGASALWEWLQAHAGEDGRCTAVIDPARYPELAQCAQALGLDADAFDALPNLYAHYTPALRQWGPRLYEAAPDDLLWPAICAQAHERQAASFIIAPSATDDLFAHLKSLIKLLQPDGSRLLFRFQDTVVLSSLMPLLSPTQARALLGPAVHWMVLDVCGQPVSVQRGNPRGSVPSTLILDVGQLRALDDALLPGTIIAQANETDSTLLGGMGKCAQWRLVRGRIARARGHGLQVAEDVALFCVLSLQLPDDFDRDGPVARALERSRREHIGFGEAIDQVPVAEWRAWDEVLDTRQLEE